MILLPLRHKSNQVYAPQLVRFFVVGWHPTTTPFRWSADFHTCTDSSSPSGMGEVNVVTLKGGQWLSIVHYCHAFSRQSRFMTTGIGHTCGHGSLTSGISHTGGHSSLTTSVGQTGTIDCSELPKYYKKN